MSRRTCSRPRRTSRSLFTEPLEPRCLLAAALLTDANPLGASSNPSFLTEVNGIVYFVGYDPIHGHELWKTDGTDAGTTMVKEIIPGPDRPSDYSDPTGPIEALVNFNGTLYFAVSNSIYGPGLWKTDGTEAGTVMVKAMSVASYAATSEPFDSSPHFAVLGDSFLFSSGFSNGLWRSDGTELGTTWVTNTFARTKMVAAGGAVYFGHGALWKTDGTEAGTVMVMDTNTLPATFPSNPYNLTNINGTLFFVANDGIHGEELWKSDGTHSGTIMVKDIRTGSKDDHSRPNDLIEMDGALFFTAEYLGRRQIFKSDGTESGTVLVHGFEYIGDFADPHDLVNINGTLYFLATTKNDGMSLWKTDGTAAGTVILKVLREGTGAYIGERLRDEVAINAGGTLMVLVDNRQLWRSDGTLEGTVLVTDTYPGSQPLPVDYLDVAGGPVTLYNQPPVYANGTLFFGAENGPNGIELWTSDGTASGTAMVKDVSTGTAKSDPVFLSNFNGEVIFGAFNGTLGGLWRSDSFGTGTKLITGLRVASNSVQVGQRFYFAADNGRYDALWKSDGTAAGTTWVKNFSGSHSDSDPEYLTSVNGTLYFIAEGAGRELWKSDGTRTGTVLLKDIKLGGASAFENYTYYMASPHGRFDPQLTYVNGTIFFLADDGTRSIELWKTDGTSAGTLMVKDIYPGNKSSLPSNFTIYNGQLYFTADDGVHGMELWKSDGTEAGTVMVKDIWSSYPALKWMGSQLIVYNGLLYFGAYDGQRPALWRSDGTEAGTVVFKDMATTVPTVVGDTMYFFGWDSANGQALWKSDGTTAGTVPVRTIDASGTGRAPSKIISNNGTMFFIADDGVHGLELWVSDGTEAGTKLVKDIIPGTAHPEIAELTIAGGTLYFTANDTIHGRELWQSDGTEAGTFIAAEFIPGPLGSFPDTRDGNGRLLTFAGLTSIGGRLYFPADDQFTGKELWTLIPNSLPSTPSSDSHTLRLDPTAHYLQLFNTIPPTGLPISTILPSSLTHLSLDATGQDTLFLDLSNGQPLSSTTLHLTAGNLKLQIDTPPKTLHLASLTLAPGSALDLADTTLILSNADLSTLESLIASKQLFSSSATEFTGLSISQSASQITIKYTYNGDMNQDGVVNALDYFIIDSSFLSQTHGVAVGYSQGDLNFDDTINAADYFLIDSAFLAQTSPLSTALASHSSPFKPEGSVSVESLLHRKPHQRFSSTRIRNKGQRTRNN